MHPNIPQAINHQLYRKGDGKGKMKLPGLPIFIGFVDLGYFYNPWTLRDVVLDHPTTLLNKIRLMNR